MREVGKSGPPYLGRRAGARGSRRSRGGLASWVPSCTGRRVVRGCRVDRHDVTRGLVHHHVGAAGSPHVLVDQTAAWTRSAPTGPGRRSRRRSRGTSRAERAPRAADPVLRRPRRDGHRHSQRDPHRPRPHGHRFGVPLRMLEGEAVAHTGVEGLAADPRAGPRSCSGTSTATASPGCSSTWARSRPAPRSTSPGPTTPWPAFTVDHVDTVAKSAFPTEAVFGATRDAELRLITRRWLASAWSPGAYVHGATTMTNLRNVHRALRQTDPGDQRGDAPGVRAPPTTATPPGGTSSSRSMSSRGASTRAPPGSS